MEIGLVRKINIDTEMQQAYLDYAMSVIVARALPDARDGLKPVHRRILYAMYDMGIRADTDYKKSARIVGEVLGKYHPHGDMAVYDAMARMAQDFSMRCLLINGQGNFGSVDGDPPAAMRYTEARLHRAALEMLADIGKDTVNFSDNFDGTLKEPMVLPSALPNLLVNGATGIAVGMATSIPPHNLGEVIDAIQFMIERWEKLDDISLDDLMQFVQGPDFPTGGIILAETGEEGLHSAYASGKGRVTIQAKAHLEEMDRGRSRIIVTELPYMTNKSSLIERIAELVREERLEGIADLRDESDRQGMRIVIELSKSAEPEKVLRDLYKHTPMQSTFSIIMLALVEGEPRMLSLKTSLRVYIEHRLEIVRRRSEFELARARQRAHILEGLLIALKNLDDIIATIRRSPDVETARDRLMRKYKLTEVQAQAILDMPLRRLAALERKKIEDEYKELTAQIKELETLLASPKKMRSVVSQELAAAKETYGDRRRTQIVTLKEGEKRQTLLTTGDLVVDETVWVCITPDGLISKIHQDSAPRLSGKESPLWVLQANSRDVLYLAAENGEAAAVAVHTIPQAETPVNGVPIEKACALRGAIRLAGLFTASAKERPEDQFILTISASGMIKKSALSELPGASASTFTLAKVNDGDRLCSVHVTNGSNEILLGTSGGMAIRFSEDEVRPMGLVAAGVMGIKLSGADEIAGSAVLPGIGEVFLLASDGNAKRVPVDGFPKQGRYGQGVQAWKLAAGARLIGVVVGKGTHTIGVHLLKLAPKSIRLDEAPLTSRAARGSVILAIKAGEAITGLAIPQGTGKTADSAEPVKPSRQRAAKAPTPAAKTPAKKTTAAAKKPAASAAKKPAASKAPPAKTAAKPAAKKPAASSSKSSSKPAAAPTSRSKTGTQAPLPLDIPESKPPAKKRTTKP